jgi:excinuclease UvrABC nuclease subunit
MTIIKQTPLMPWNELNIQQTPDATGVYELCNSAKVILYIGRTRAPRRLRERILDHWRLKDVPGIAYFAWHQTDTEENAASVEAEWIKRYHPPYNTQGR